MFTYNPLLNEVVLTKVFCVLPTPELTNCRKVCSRWNYLILPSLKQKIIVKLFSVKHLEEFLEISTYNDTDEYDFDLPFINFHIRDIPLENLLSSKFLDTYSNNLTSLKIEFNLTVEENVNNLFNVLLRPLSSLESLTVCNIADEFEFGQPPSVLEKYENGFQKLGCLKRLELSNCNRIFLKDLFNIAGQLEAIVVIDRISTSFILEALASSQHSRTVKELCLTDLDEDNIEPLCDFIVNKQMRLEIFKVKEINLNVRSSSLEQLFNKLKVSITDLSVGELLIDREMLTELPVMKCLKKLAITTRNGKVCKIFSPIDYPRKLHNLNKLSLDSCRCDQLNLENLFSPYFDSHNEPCFSLKEIGFPQYMNDPNLLKRIGKMFPSITSVRIAKPSDEVLSSLWSTWPALGELEITITLSNKNIDSILTGISAGNCMKIIGHRGKSAEIADFIRNKQESIVDLKELSRLKLQTLYGYGNLAENSILVTDITGYFALAEMTSLRDLCIETNDLSEECRQVLQERLQLTTCKIERPQRDWSYSSIIDYNFQCLYWEEEFC